MTTQKTLQKQAERKEVRINKLLSLLAQKPLYREEIARAMAISLGTLHDILRHARSQGWVISQGRYYINPHNVMVADGKIVRNHIQELETMK